MSDQAEHSVRFCDVAEAAQRIKPEAHTTPVFTCETLNKLAGRTLYFKAENMQKIGAFKFRGAMNAVKQLTPEEASRGVVTHSSGNHAQALALAARMRGVKAFIVMPSTAPKVKRAAVEGYGATVITSGPNPADRETVCNKVLEETGGIFIAPYNNLRVIAGAGTAAFELFHQTTDSGLLDAVFAPVGGGGLLSGTCLASKGLNPRVKVFGAEPKGADDAFQSLAAGHIIPQTNPRTIADGLCTSLGSLTWPIIRDNITEIITVSEQEIMDAMFLLWERLKLVVEPSGAVSLAAVLSEKFKNSYPEIKTVGIILSGGNLDIKNWDWNQLENKSG